MHTFYKLNMATLDDYFKIKDEVSRVLADIKIASIYEKFIDFSYDYYSFNLFYSQEKNSYYPDIIDGLIRMEIYPFDPKVSQLLLTCLEDRKDKSPLTFLDFFEEITYQLSKQSAITAFTPRSAFIIHEIEGNYYLELLDITIGQAFLKWARNTHIITEFSKLDTETSDKLILMKSLQSNGSLEINSVCINEVKFKDKIEFSEGAFLKAWLSYSLSPYRFYRECYINSQGAVRGKKIEDEYIQTGQEFTHKTFSQIRREIINDYDRACENNDSQILNGLPSMEDVLNFTFFEKSVTFK